MEPRCRPEDVMAVRFTSGTTRRPKGVLRRFARPPRPALLSGACFLLRTPLGHGGGATADFALAAGGTVVLQEGFVAEDVLAAVERYRVSRACLPSHLLYGLLDHPLPAATGTGSLQRVGYTGCPPSPRRLAETTRRLGRVLRQTYNLTEYGPVSRLSPDEHLDPRLLTTAGRPYPDTEVRTGRPVIALGGARGGVTRPCSASSARADHLSRGGRREETDRGHSTARAELPIHPGGAPSHRPQEALP
ncbi:AMP-binding protein [Kitasatospora sp. NPDC001683]